MALLTHEYENVIPLPLPELELKEIIEKTKDWAVMHGLGMRSRTAFSTDSITFAPFKLLPSPFPRNEFQKAVSLQVILNELIHRVAHDMEFLRECLRDTIQVDEFTGNLFKIYKTVQDEGVAQPISLVVVRSDYLLEAPNFSTNEKRRECILKQVEMNTMATGFSWLGNESVNMHRYVLQQLGKTDEIANLPPTNSLRGVCEGMIESWKIYGNENATIVFLVNDRNYNICDQRFQEFEINNINPRVKVIRRTLTQIADKAHLNGNKELVIDDYIIALVYFQALYVPDHYHSQKEWDARLLIERSLAIKCPAIQYQLAGTKKVQQALAVDKNLKKFLSNANDIKSVKEVFTRLYGLEFDEYGDQAIQMALSEPEKYVLKPQREGGGNNMYGVKLHDAIFKMKNTKERTAWILMELISPPTTSGYIVRPGDSDVPEVANLVSELGIFGVIIGDSKTIFHNRQVGHMLRTKNSNEEEGGIMAGVGALDSPYLID